MRIFGFIAISVMLAGCNSTPQPPAQANDPAFAPVIPDIPREQITEDGALFRPYMANSLYSDVTARRVGDIITVTLSENTAASKTADTTTAKSTGVDVQPITGLGGDTINLGSQSIQFGLNSSNDFTGNAQANQSNSLSGAISVTVVDVMPNQNLVIRGEKWLTLNQGDEYIRLTGIIRPADISPENEIVSTKIANARIQYSGTGSFARAQEKGWLTRFFSSDVWPFQERRMPILRFLLTAAVIFTAPLADAQRIKDVASIQGVRSNQLVGYGLVVGLPGTGEQSPFTEQSFRTMLSNFGISLDPNTKPKIKNVAAVAVHAELPPFIKPGQSIDVTVSSVGEASSLQGGTLLQTFLKGVDGKVYAVAQGSLIVSGFGAQGGDGSRIVVNTPTVGRIPNGAFVEQTVPSGFANGDTLTLNLHYPDFSTAKRLADTINERLGAQPDQGYTIATPIDAASVRVTAPRDVGQRVGFLATVENFDFEPADAPARVVINSRTGTIVIGQDVVLLPAAITHGGLTVTIAENQQVSQPNALADGNTVVTTQSIVDVDMADSRMFKFEPGVTLDQLVRAVNEVGAAPGDLMAILEALRQAGALRGELVII